jgi:hypothetical protein
LGETSVKLNLQFSFPPKETGFLLNLRVAKKYFSKKTWFLTNRGLISLGAGSPRALISINKFYQPAPLFVYYQRDPTSRLRASIAL